ncbi:MAG TPA: TonB-dependent receptor plug domain-containing protein, partial [Steroidobacteraceae bacterium]|nr:TonB-dependent receptor plug domain-containing protein [Steroidobacteraceae bacterium]
MKMYPDSAAAVGACSLLLALQLAGPAAGHAADAATADPAPAANVQAADVSGSSSEQLHEVIVTGIRADLEKALDTKEFAPVMLDSIDSTELGRFPDADVADSLEHLPGITVSRTTGGEGQKITVQGLSSEYNIVT